MKGRETSLGGGRRAFPETVWEVVRQAGTRSEAERRKGLEEMARLYWKPVYGYLRLSWSRPNEDCKDLVQAFFLWLFEGDALAKYDPARGRFRAFLKSLLKHFVQHHDEAMSRLKRGGGVTLLPLEGHIPDPRPSDPDAAFDRVWRESVLQRGFAAVRARLEARGKSVQMSVFEAYDLVPAAERPTYRDLAARFGVKESDVHNYLDLVREEIRDQIREEFTRSASNPDDIEHEWTEFLGS
jgi:DNA-directed RNA polymerase specialized sigma24 family protein